jgi:hypothetical protein
MGLKTYNVTANGTTATLRLSEADAKARGLTAADLVTAKKPAPKTAGRTAPKQAPAPLNKSRAAATKAE